MPYSGDPQQVPRDAVRLLVGDLSTAESSEFLSDSDYDFFVAETPNRYLAASMAATSLAALFAGSAASASGTGYVEKTVGDLKIKKSDAAQTAASYSQMAAAYRRKAATSISPFAGGISISDKASNAADTDRPLPAFVARLFDNSNAVDFAGGSSTS